MTAIHHLALFAIICLTGKAHSVTLEQECFLDGTCANADVFVTGDSGNLTTSSSFASSVISEASCEVPPPAPETDAKLGSDMGEAQAIDDSHGAAILSRITQARDYMEKAVMVDDSFEKVRSICKNKHELCALWSVLGECEDNPGYMQTNCGPVCNSCEMLHVETRCPLDPDAVDAFHPGDLNKMFEKIATAPEYQQYEPKVVSRPPEGPWMILFENVLSDEETDRLIELGGHLGYERSADVGDEQPDGTHSKSVNSRRTSTNAWCLGECYEDRIARRVMQRIENITGIPEANSENLQLLRYEKDQFYQTHSDYIPYQVDRPTGVRVLTFYIYLNDVEEGGGTNFPELKLTVKPKRGRAALWPSVLDDDPNEKDSRTDHQAMPVIKGEKYGANAWLHQRDFKANNLKGC